MGLTEQDSNTNPVRVGISFGFTCIMTTTTAPQTKTPEKFAYNLHTTFSGVYLNDIDNLVERETGFEPATSTLARLHSTTELFPQHRTLYYSETKCVNPVVRAAIPKILLCQAKLIESPRFTVPPLITFAKTPCSGMMHSPILL